MTDWEKHYVDGMTPWEKGGAAPALVQALEKSPLTGRILVPGCGLGHDVRAIAAASPDAKIVGLDVAPSALEQAETFPKAGKESYFLGDLFNLPSEMIGSFDWVWEHTCFCAIDPSMRDDYVVAVGDSLSEKGQLFGVFFLNPYDEEHREEDHRPPFGTTVDELERRFAPTFEILRSWEPDVAYPGREGLEWMMSMRKIPK
ncbi:MAG: methyltransferase [Verrucomicrobiota bacterium]